MMEKELLKKIGIFAGGVLFGTAGVKVLGSSDAKKVYVNCLAAGLRAKDSVMTTATNIQENAEDILAEAKEINRQRSEEVFEDQEEMDWEMEDMSDEDGGAEAAAGVRKAAGAEKPAGANAAGAEKAVDSAWGTGAGKSADVKEV